MDSNQVIKQNSPGNILWRLFRIGVEEEKIPAEVAENNQEFVNNIKPNADMRYLSNNNK